MIKRIAKYPLIIIFLVLIYGIFTLYLVLPDIEISEWENRYLQLRPKIGFSDLKDGSYMENYEEYINDQLPFRDFFIKVKAVCETAAFKVENNGIAKGKDSFLFTKEIKGTEIFDKNISIIGKFCEGTSNDVTVAIAPNACAILEDNVPGGLPFVNQKEKLLSLISDKSLLNGANVVDLYSAVNAHGDEYIYYRTDHHWTTNGAYLAYQQIVSSDECVSISELKGHEITGFYGTLYAKYKGINVKPDVLTYYEIPIKNFTAQDGKSDISFDSLYDLDAASKFDKYALFLHGNFGYSEIKSGSVQNGKTAIIFKDSYANCLIPFLTYNYENLIVIDLRFFNKSVSELMENNHDADVIFIHNFDFLNDDNHFYKLMK